MGHNDVDDYNAKRLYKLYLLTHFSTTCAHVRSTPRQSIALSPKNFFKY